MKSKLLALFAVALIAVVAFASCDDINGGDHTHTFSGGWTTNATHHWHAATCEHGEVRDGYSEHIDSDEDGICDNCAYEVGHTHKFGDEWQSDETHHWKNPTCTHKDEKGEYELHADEDIDGVCDKCAGHVHTLNTFGFCTGCDKETKPVDENALGSVVYAASARKKFVVGGAIGYSFAGNNRTEGQINTMLHDVKYSLGTNGVYLERSYKNIEGEDEIQKDWIKRLPNGDATGITAILTNGVVTAAQPSSFSGDSLDGYYYAVSTLADGHGAENVLKALYEASADEKSVQNLEVIHDADANKYTFKFDTLIVHETSVGQGDESENVYNVGYFVVEVSFTYTDDYVLTSLDIKCECYTNDPGADMSGTILEADIDLDYDPVTGHFALRTTAAPDTYVIKVTQTVGEKSEIELNDGTEFAPSGFEINKDGAPAGDMTVNVGENFALNLVGTPADTFMSFIKNELVLTVTDEAGNSVKGVDAILHGFDEIDVYPKAPGTYVITLKYKDVVKSIKLEVVGIALGGEKTFNVESTDNNAWNQVYEFKAEANGEYVFYLPYGAGAATFTELDQYDDPLIEDKNIIFDFDNDPADREGGVSFTKTLRKGQTFKICFKFKDRGVTYTIGYDEP